MDNLMRERFCGLMKYALRTRVEVLRYEKNGTDVLRWRSPSTGRLHANVPRKAALEILLECLDDFESYFASQVAIGRCDTDSEFRKCVTRFVADVASPVGRFWRQATWLDEWDDAFQRDNQARDVMVDELLGALMHNSANERG